MQELQSDINIEAIAALNQLWISNSGTIRETIINTRPFTKNKNIPRVKIVIGKVKIIKRGRISIFANAKIKAAIIAVGKS